MKRILIMAGMTIGSIGGWYAGAYFGEFFIPLIVSGVGAFAGTIIAWKLTYDLD